MIIWSDLTLTRILEAYREPQIIVIKSLEPRPLRMPMTETDKDFSPYDPRGKLYGLEKSKDLC